MMLGIGQRVLSDLNDLRKVKHPLMTIERPSIMNETVACARKII